MARRPKYGNRRTSSGHASEREALRIAELRMRERAGEISELREQVRFELIPAQRIDGKLVERAVTYRADAVYFDRDRNYIVEDAKGFRTQQYIIRRKLMLYVHGIRIREV